MSLRDRIRTIIYNLCDEFPEYRERLLRMNVELSSRMTSAAGKASYRTNTIKISTVFFRREENLPHLQNTVTHEVAHLLAGHGAGHGPIWRAIHRKLGGTGERCHSMSNGLAPRATRRRYKLSCLTCGWHAMVGVVRWRRQFHGEAQYLCNRCRGHLKAD